MYSITNSLREADEYVALHGTPATEDRHVRRAGPQTISLDEMLLAPFKSFPAYRSLARICRPKIGRCLLLTFLFVCEQLSTLWSLTTRVYQLVWGSWWVYRASEDFKERWCPNVMSKRVHGAELGLKGNDRFNVSVDISSASRFLSVFIGFGIRLCKTGQKEQGQTCYDTH